MRAASKPRSVHEHRVLVVDGVSGEMHVARSSELATLFEPGDLLVVNDAATLPASLPSKTASGDDVELRLVSFLEDRRWTAGLLGAGDHRTRTEDRPPPPRLRVGDELLIGETRDDGVDSERNLVARVVRVHDVSPRLVDVELGLRGPDAEHDDLDAIWSALYRAGRPVQYAHVPEPLALWDVQNVYAARPWAVEMPSAGRVLTASSLLALRRRGVEIARVTHAAGISSIGDPVVDAMLPLPERFEVKDETWDAIAEARKRGGRVIAIGTSTARALEGAARSGGRRSAVTDLKMGPSTRRAIVDAVLTGVHDTDTSHFSLLRAFTSEEILGRALARAEREELLGHELGDACLVWGQPRENVRNLRGEDSPEHFFQAVAAAPISVRRRESRPRGGLWRAGLR